MCVGRADLAPAASQYTQTAMLVRLRVSVLM